MIPDAYKAAHPAQDGSYWDDWFALLDTAVDRLATVAATRESKAIFLADSRQVANDLLADLEDEESRKAMTMTALSYGVGKQVWDMRFSREDGTEVPDEEVREQIRIYDEAPEGTEWEWGQQVIVSHVLKTQDKAP